jgi:two-component system sensor histidine kinase BarA
MERVRDEFFAVASHELRTPLTAIRGNTSMIKQFYEKLLQDDQNLAEMIDDIHNSSVHLIDIVNDFLDVSKLEQNKVEYKMTAFDLGTLLTEALFDLETSAKDKGLDFGLVQSDKPVSLVYADEGRTREVVYNLVGNAIKYTEAGSVKVWLTEEKGMVVVRVVDTGMGISQESQRLLFRKFQRAGEGFLTQNVVQGTGLGLYVSKLLVEGMGGEISLEKSESGVGSTFVFKLRMAE